MTPHRCHVRRKQTGLPSRIAPKRQSLVDVGQEHSHCPHQSPPVACHHAHPHRTSKVGRWVLRMDQSENVCLHGLLHHLFALCSSGSRCCWRACRSLPESRSWGSRRRARPRRSCLLTHLQHLLWLRLDRTQGCLGMHRCWGPRLPGHQRRGHLQQIAMLEHVLRAVLVPSVSRAQRRPRIVPVRQSRGHFPEWRQLSWGWQQCCGLRLE